VPFGERRFGEDLDWGRRILLAGHKIAYVPRSCVVHSHDRSPWYELKRVYLDSQTKCLLFGVRLVPRRRDIIWRTLAGTRYGLRTVASNPSLSFTARVTWGARALPYSFGQSLAQYLGARSVARLAAGSRAYRWIDRVLGHGV
jgi:rhamnosyltransferase